MPDPRRIQLSRRKGWRLPEGAVSVARPAIWGNPFIIGQTLACEDREDAVAMYEDWLAHGHTAPYPRPGESARLSALRETVLARLPELHGRDLACWCPPPAEGCPDICHGAVLLAAANGWGGWPDG